ncbi:tRNA (guanosine(37)-N1)-methyltransferase TrmD [Candidatus Woesebacteria bacterium RBG_19FT_COMBO_42_9]|uniref:tRNA (guanine-N(1)-)-methyltransferase n=1 Tax=Candidatus Woesebacteria bacterium RBG_16_42_24 TaxID=1802485 RepID=A0A1F7XKC0_9BACT|nr:MAG: tRNA (guanosine(37)-N1)-methyltransferase TrmD [Candidatus Woesebacteria bacterium RBG_16_42_24]OGM16288.1 MAG: tRNA (guanosine(37)-N1)-methyltransferase TrmD [Candidatus Woesebacteria bacterium RBG_19FT_COMBO_42_9]OGM68613.1 MAG: tRNA (guanosine(37)-N1)-methyltransferase TrmD [Candidatus Woesebacteria bacterium RIFCSPLOWO2_01_FULL_43_11]
MQIDILTLFPKMFSGPFDESIIRRAQDKGLVDIKIHDLREYGEGERRSVDDRPYGGGVGMILRVDIIDKALSALVTNHKSPNTKVVLLDATGKKFTQKVAKDLSRIKHLILIAGHYEGVDTRVHEHLVDEIISIGDYVLTGGEIPAMVVTDAVVRLLHGVLEKPEATTSESFSPITNHQSPVTTLEFPQYTRPEVYRGWKVPKVLLSGNHKEIEKWRKSESLKKTKKVRPDLIPDP